MGQAGSPWGVAFLRRAVALAAVALLVVGVLVIDPPSVEAAAPPVPPACPMPANGTPFDPLAMTRAGDCAVDFTVDPYTGNYVHVATATMSPSTVSFGDGSDQSVTTTWTPDFIWERPTFGGETIDFTPRGRLGSPEWPCTSSCAIDNGAIVRTRLSDGSWSTWRLTSDPPFQLKAPYLSCEITATTCGYRLQWRAGSQGQDVPDMQVLIPVPWHPMDASGSALFAARTIWMPVSVEGGPGTGHPPVASFDFEPYGSTGTQWRFFSTSTDPDGPDDIVDWQWDFGDGTSSVGESVIKSIPAGAVRDITLTVTDRSGRTGSVTRRFGEGALDISQVLVDPAIPKPGEDTTVTVRVRNPGTASATGVVPSLTGITPAGGLTIDSGPSPPSATIAAGATADFTYNVKPGPVDQVSVQVGASGTSNGNPVSATAVTRIIDVELVGLSATLTSSADHPSPGDEVEVTAIVHNLGDQTVTGLAPGALSVSPDPTSITGPVPTPPLTLAPDASATFGWKVTFEEAGAHALSVDVAGTTAGLPVSAPTAHLTIDVGSHPNLTAQIEPPENIPSAGPTFPIKVHVTNRGDVAIDDLTLALDPVPVVAGAVVKPVGDSISMSGSIAPGTTRIATANFRATSPGRAAFHTFATGKDHVTGSPVEAVGDVAFDVVGPRLIFGSRDETGVSRDNVVGRPGTIVGREWDPSGGPITVEWAGKVVATVPATAGFERPFALPPFPDKEGDDRCSPASMVAKQGDVTVVLPVAGIPVEKVLASDRVDLVGGQEIGSGVRCKGELFDGPSVSEFLLVTEALPEGGRERLGPGGVVEDVTYTGLWVQAADIDVLGVIAREVVVETPRLGVGPTTRHTFASTEFYSPGNVDPRGEVEAVIEIVASYLPTATDLDVVYAASHSVVFGEPVVCDDGFLFGSTWLWFAKGLTQKAGAQTCFIAANEAIRIAGAATAVGNLYEGEGTPRSPSLFSRRVELLRAGTFVGAVAQDSEVGANELEVTDGDFALGDSVLIGPETDHGEPARKVTGFGSIILDQPMASPHAKGEQVLNLAGLSESTAGTPPATGGGPAPSEPVAGTPPDAGSVPAASESVDGTAPTASTPPAPSDGPPAPAGELARTGSSTDVVLALVAMLAILLGAVLICLSMGTARTGASGRTANPR